MLAEIIKGTGVENMRGFFAGALQKRRGVQVISEKTAGGERLVRPTTPRPAWNPGSAILQVTQAGLEAWLADPSAPAGQADWDRGLAVDHHSSRPGLCVTT
jgi:hypothetical protein